MRMIFLFILISGLAINLFSKDEYEITVYNQDLGLVKTIRKVSLDKGITDYKFDGVSKFIDPTSLYCYSDKIAVLEQNYQFDLLNYEKLLNKYLGKEITIIRYDDKGNKLEEKKGNLLSIENDKVSIFKTENKLELYPDGKIILPNLPEGLLLEPTLLLKLNVIEPNEQALELDYLTSGMSWYSTYNSVISKDDDKLNFTGWVTLTNTTGITFDDAKLKLVAGDVNLIKESYKKRFAGRSRNMLEKAMVSAEPEFKEESFFEYHLYSLARKTTIRNNETKQVLFINGTNININKKFVFDPEGNKYSNIESNYDADNFKKVSVILEFKNEKSNNLGIALPKGKIRMYKSDSDNQLQFIGEDKIEHTPEGETIALNTGKSFDIICEKKQTSHKSAKNSNDETWQVLIKNHKKESVTIYVIAQFSYNWEVKKTNFKYNKLDAYTVEFPVKVNAKSDETLEYEVYYWWPE